MKRANSDQSRKLIESYKLVILEQETSWNPLLTRESARQIVSVSFIREGKPLGREMFNHVRVCSFGKVDSLSDESAVKNDCFCIAYAEVICLLIASASLNATGMGHLLHCFLTGIF